MMNTFPVPTSFSDVKKHLKDPLYENSFYIMLSYVVASGAGFFFWIIAAKLYPAHAVGLAVAMISSLQLIIMSSRLGLDTSLIRFLPEYDGKERSTILSTTLIVSTAASILIALTYIAGLDIWASDLRVLKELKYLLLFLCFIAAYSVLNGTANTFIASRKAKYQFIQNVLTSSRIAFVFPLIFLGSMGIFASFGIAALLTMIFSLVIVFVKIGIKPSVTISKSYIREALHFSSGNYLADLLVLSPNFIIPLMILNMLGPEPTAYYYIAFTVASLLNLVSSAVSTSLLVEGSHGESLKRTVFKSLYGMYTLLIPGMIVFFFFGNLPLTYIGNVYSSQGFELLRVLVISFIFVPIRYVFYSIKRIQKDVKSILIISLIYFILIVSTVYFFIQIFGIIGTGYGWIVTNMIIASLIIVIVKKKERWL